MGFDEGGGVIGRHAKIYAFKGGGQKDFCS